MSYFIPNQKKIQAFLPEKMQKLHTIFVAFSRTFPAVCENDDKFSGQIFPPVFSLFGEILSFAAL
jgi:hypothetical protein